MFTAGKFYKEEKDWIIVKYPLTYQFDENIGDYKSKLYKEEEPTFFFISKGMIVKIVPGEIEPRT